MSLTVVIAIPVIRFPRESGPGTIRMCPVPVAPESVLQLATRDIGQLTDLEPMIRVSLISPENGMSALDPGAILLGAWYVRCAPAGLLVARDSLLGCRFASSCPMAGVR